jgi:hypothetical protein
MKNYFKTVGTAMLLTLCGLTVIPMVILIFQHIESDYSWLQRMLNNIK